MQQEREEIQTSILLRIGKIDNLPMAENSNNSDLSSNKKHPNSAPASIAPPSESTVSIFYFIFCFASYSSLQNNFLLELLNKSTIILIKFH